MSRQPVRLITTAWGERYIDELFSLTLPAVLAPNNLPALAAHFDCELVIITEQSWFGRLRSHPVYTRLEQYCSVELRPIDDLITRADAYGMSLTYALFRGFEELGPQMVDRQLIFLNADFILADGSLRSVAERILAGERLILAPSYCVVGEIVTPWLAARQHREHGYLAVPPREMAAVALRNRHNTIRGKTVNQRAFSAEWMDQFYWLVDEQTLIGHQLPFAVVSMRPTRVLTEMRTFWDYGIISEACPTTPRCVIADSDDFLMIELRSADTARDQLRLGWPEPKEIAGRLKQFVTKDPLSLARYTLILHSGDLPPELDEAKAKLDRFVEAVLATLPSEPTHWANHPIWAYHYPRFHEARAAFLGGHWQPLSAGSTALVAASAEPALPVSAAGSGPRAIGRRLYNRWFGRAPWFRRVHPRWADVQPVLKVLRENVDAPTLIVTSTGLASRLFENVAARHMTVAALGLPREVEVLRSMSLSAGEPGRLHIESEQPIRAELLLDGDAAPQIVNIRSLDLAWDDGGKTGVTAARTSLRLEVTHPTPSPPAEKYGLCLFELNIDDLRRLPQLLEQVTSWILPDGKIMVFHINNTSVGAVAEALIGMNGLWLDLPCTIHFVGSKMSVWALNRFFSSITALRTRRPLAATKGLVGLVGACFAALSTSRSGIAHSRREPAIFSSVTLEINVPRRETVEAPPLNDWRAIA